MIDTPAPLSEPLSAQDHPWHSIDAEVALMQLDARRDGLSAAEAEARIRRCGPNALPETKSTPPLLRFLAQFNSALIYFLLAAALAAALIGHAVDAAVIVILVIVNAAMGFVQEGKAEQALAAIRGLISEKARALRDGERCVVAAESLVPGDIILLEAGDRAPADGRLIHARSFTVDEALLTGESVTAVKHEGPVAADAPLGDRASMIYSGSIIATGQGVAVVTETGARTEIGRISGLVRDAATVETPLLKRLNRFGRLFSIFVFLSAAALFAFAVLARGFDWREALIAVVAVAVGAIPEGLPAVITITLAVGVRRMAARKAVIRRLPAVEALGSTSVICTDKTGTLTKNEMTVRRILAPGFEIEVSGSGYAPEGALYALDHDDDSVALAASAPLLRCGILCNDARLRHEAEGWTIDGDTMDGALLVLAGKAGLDPSHMAAEWPRLDEYPFDAAHRFMATLHRGPHGERVIFAKGAPEAILGMCGSEAPTAQWETDIARAAAEGERVLGFARKTLAQDSDRLDKADLASGFEPLGLMGFIDPPRPEAQDAVAQCRSAGIAVKMITGDHAATASAIARQIGLADQPRALTGADLERMDDAALAAKVAGIDVFARANPEHKLRIVRALQSTGAVVAMTGDGVNDSPALKQADVGVSMGIKGTEAARNASEMVLLDDNFASIVAAVREGRTVHDNVRKVIAWTLPTNGGESAAVILAILAGFALPLTATQILWVNLVTAVTLGLVLAFEPTEDGVMRRAPLPPQAPLLSPFLLWRVILVSLLFAAAVLAVFFGAQKWGADIETARTMTVNTLICLELFYLFNVRFLHARSITLRGALGTKPVLIALAALLAAQALFTYFPAMNVIFDSRPLALGQLTAIVGLSALVMVIIEAEKWLLRKTGWVDVDSA